jgi:hypothetical protein
MEHSRFVILYDLVDPNDPAGRSYRQINATKTHAIPLGALVEVDSGVRLFVVLQTRDCDMTPPLSPVSQLTGAVGLRQ